MTHKRGTTGPVDTDGVIEAGADEAADAALAERRPGPDAQSERAPDSQPNPGSDAQPGRAPDSQPGSAPSTIAATLALVDRAWARFHALASHFPPERMDERLDGGWTRKQMLAHVAGWHDLTSDRLLAFVKSGERQRLEDDVDVINGRFARAAAGRTAGEVLHALETSFRRLRRQVEALTDEQLAMHEGWPAAVIAGDTFDHYAEHGPELERPGAPANPRR